MSKYPTYYSGLRLTAALLAADQTDKVVKTAGTGKLNNTLADDPELAGISLGVGTFDVRCMIMCSNPAATGDIKTRWTFTGTWNTPLRICMGPGPTNTGLSDAITPYKARAWATNQDSVYGLAASGAYAGIEEQCSYVTVTVAGTLALNWAQNTTDGANATTVQLGSYMEVRQIA